MNKFKTNSSMFDEMFGELTELFGTPSQPSRRPTGYTPKYDILSMKDKTTVIFELPGVDKKNISVKTEDDFLVISGTKEQPDIGTEFNTIRNSLVYGDFTQQFQLSDDDDATSIDAKMKKGLLIVTIDKLKNKKQKSTSININ